MCLLTAVVVRLFLVKVRKGHLLCNGINNRISNTLVDFLVCGTFISIQAGSVAQYIVPFLISCTVYTIVLASVYYWYCCKLQEEDVETFAFLFGTATGTISTAFVLLRLVDPTGKAQVPIYSAYGNALSIPSAIIIPAIMHMEPIYNMSPWYAIGAQFVFVAVLMVFAFLFRQPTNDIAWKPKVD